MPHIADTIVDSLSVVNSINQVNLPTDSAWLDSAFVDTLSAVASKSYGAMKNAAKVLTDTVSLVVSDDNLLPNIPLSESFAGNPLITVLLFVMFFSFGYIVIARRTLLKEIMNESFYLKKRSSIFSESVAKQFSFQFNVQILFVGSVGMFLYSFFYDNPIIKIENETFQGAEQYLNLILFLGIAVLFLAFRFASFRILSQVIFRNAPIAELFIRCYSIIIYYYGIALYPIVTLMAFSPENFFSIFQIAAVIVSFIAFFMILIKTFQIFLRKISDLFYIILYFCVLEILPILIVVKVLISI